MKSCTPGRTSGSLPVTRTLRMPKYLKNVREAGEFGPGQNFVVIAIVFRVSGTAIDAAKIAAIGDRNTQIGNLSAESSCRSIWVLI